MKLSNLKLRYARVAHVSGPPSFIGDKVPGIWSDLKKRIRYRRFDDSRIGPLWRAKRTSRIKCSDLAPEKRLPSLSG